MSVHFISGKPGAGKSLYAMRLLVWELQHTTRTIVTNLCINYGNLNAYLTAQGQAIIPEQHIRDRVLRIEDEDLKVFFTFRGGGVRVRCVSIQEWKAGVRPDYSVVKDAGCFYVLDEVHIAFNARAWADTGQEVMYYLSQHRKLGDDVILITQAVLNVDKQMRSVAQDFTYIRNFKKEKAGFFRLPAIFMRRTYLEPAGPTSKATESGTFTLDVSGVASCYDTAAGVGIHGRASADKNEKSRGLHWAWYVVFILAFIFGLIKGVPPFIEWLVAPGGSKRLMPIAQASAGPGHGGVITNQAAPTHFDNSAPLTFKPKYPKCDTNYWITGRAMLRGGWVVYLNDGTMFTQSRNQIDEMGEDYAILEGVHYPIGQRKLVKLATPGGRLDSGQSKEGR